MKKILILGAVTWAGFIGTAMTASAQTDDSWLLDLQNSRCSPESKQTIADTIRKQIEDKVARATAAIQPPAAIGDLSCLNDLMTAPLDSFSNMGGILGSLQDGLGGAIQNATSGGGSISRKVCEFAADKWSSVTEPLDKRLSDISGAGSNLWENFDLTNNANAPTNSLTKNAQWSSGENVQDTAAIDNNGNTTDPATDLPWWMDPDQTSGPTTSPTDPDIWRNLFNQYQSPINQNSN